MNNKSKLMQNNEKNNENYKEKWNSVGFNKLQI